MAIVINSEAGNTSSVNNEMLFVVYEATKANDPTTYPDYSYVCDVYVDSTLVERLIARPDPTYKRGIFDVSRALQPYCTYGFKLSTDIEDYTARVAYQLKFGEQYDGTLYTNLTVDSSDRYAFKTYAVKPFTSSAVIANGLASNMPSVINTHGNPVNVQIIPYFSNVSGVTNLTVTYKDKNGATLNSATFDNSDFTANTLRQYNVENSDPDTAYALFTGPFSLRVNYQCSKYPVHTLVWLNPYGGYESQTFGLVSKKVIELSKKDFMQLDYRLNASGEVSYQANNVFYGGKKGYASNVKVKLNMTSHLLNEDEYTWLADLFISPEVYIYDGSGSFIPVTIGQSNYEYRNYKNSRLTPLQFEVEFGHIYNSQFL